MMIDKRLVGQVSGSKKYIAGNVALQWVSLLANIAMMCAITKLIAGLWDGTAEERDILLTLLVGVCAALVRFGCVKGSARMSFLSSRVVKKTLRRLIYEKLLRLGTSYREQVQTSEVVQVAVEGVDQLETYFGAYLPQFFYAMLAPVTLFAVFEPGEPSGGSSAARLRSADPGVHRSGTDLGEEAAGQILGGSILRWEIPSLRICRG